MVDKLSLDDTVHDLKLGGSFNNPPSVAYHSMRYDFKPASVDTSQKSIVEIGEGHSVTVNVPHVEGAGTTHTMYKGNKRSCQKECVLIIDHVTGEFSLEKLANTIQLKKTRKEGSSRIPAPSMSPSSQLTERRPAPPKKVPHAKKPSVSTVSATVSATVSTVSATVSVTNPETVAEDGHAPIDLISCGSSSSDDSSSNGSDAEEDAPRVQQTSPVAPSAGKSSSSAHVFHSMLSDDLRLSESSDSD